MVDPPEMSTQLADSRPKFDTALRVAIPVNAPPRAVKPSRDALIRTNAFSPASYAVGQKLVDAVATGEEAAVEKVLANSNTHGLPEMKDDSVIKNMMKDFTVVAASSKRAGKKDVEAMAYVSLGVTCDNQGKLREGIDYYVKYLQLCDEIGDVMGSACACNCLAVNYMLLASPPTDLGILQGLKDTADTQEYLSQAVHYNSKHLEIGPDNGGRFVAHTNLGLCLGMMGDIVKSAQHHQDALRVAIKMQTLYGQSIAVGNLGALALIKGDFPTARTCFEQHLQLVQSLSDPEAEIKAWDLLADLCETEGNTPDALENLLQAQRICEREGLLNELRRVNCLVGVIKAQLHFDRHVEHLLTTCLTGGGQT